jgi:hypothetical protein
VATGWPVTTAGRFNLQVRVTRFGGCMCILTAMCADRISAHGWTSWGAASCTTSATGSLTLSACVCFPYVIGAATSSTPTTYADMSLINKEQGHTSSKGRST